jgi:drug/metabolite transporter (DMT)-like permease
MIKEKSIMKKIYLLLPALAGLMFGSTGFFVRSLTENGIDPTTLLFLRFSIAAVIMFVCVIFTDKSLFKIKTEYLPYFFIAAISIVGLNLCYNESMNTIQLSLAAILLGTSPIFVIIGAYFTLAEKITHKKLGAMLLAILGCILVSGLLEKGIGSVSLIGIAGGVGAAIFFAIYTLVSTKVINKGCHIYSILFFSLIIIVALLLPFTDFGQINSYIIINPLSNVMFLILHSFVSFALPYICLTTALNYVESGTASILLSGCEPIAALIFGIIFYFEIPTVLMLCGLVIVIAALVILSKAKV